MSKLSRGIKNKQKDLRKTSNEELLHAVQSNNFDALLTLVSNQPPEILTNSIPIAIKNRNFETIELLITHGANIENYLFHLWDEQTFLKFWNGNVKISQNGNTVLHFAVKRQWIELVQDVLKCGIDVNVPNGKGVTALMMAGARNNLTLIEMLLGANADPHLEDERGCTALCYVIAYVVQKKIESTPALLKLIGIISDAYLERLELLISNQIAFPLLTVSIITFFVRYTENGLESLLDLYVFKKFKEAFESHLDNFEYVQMILTCELEVLLNGSGEAVNQFIENGGADVSITILKKYASLRSSIVASALMPIFVSCVADGKAKNWIQKNYKLVLPFYQQYLQLPTVSLSIITNDYHITLVKRKIRQFGKLIQNLQENDIDVTKTNAKRMKRKTKAWKAKVAKIRSANIIEMATKSPSLQPVQPCATPVVTSESLQSVVTTKTLCNSDNSDEETKEDLTPKINQLKKLLDQIVRKYEKVWQSDRELNYPNFKGPEDQIPKLSSTLAELEASYLQRLRAKFNESISRIETLEQAETLEHILLHHEIRGETIENNKLLIDSVDRLLESNSTEDLNLFPYSNEVKSNPPEGNFFNILRSKRDETPIPKKPPSIPLETKVVPSNVSMTNHLFSRWDAAVRNLKGVNNLMSWGELRTSPANIRIRFMVSSGGNFGDVELGLDSHGRALAVKRIPKQNNIVCKMLKNALNPLLGLRHKHLLHYAICDYDDQQLLIACPLCEFNMGEYLMCLKLNHSLMTTATSLTKQMLIGLQYLHNYPIIHGNLKPSNILIDAHGTLKLAEFGVFRALYQSVRPPKSSVIWFSRETYQMYEKASVMNCTTHSDIQVAGMLMHFILTGGLHPFGIVAEDILNNILRGTPDLKVVGCELIDLCSWMLIYEINDRPNVQQVLTHVYFWDSERKWQFLLACAGITQHGSPIPVSLSHLHATLDASAARDHIKGDWVSVVKAKLPGIRLPEGSFSDTPTGLLRFLRACTEERQLNNRSLGGLNLQNFFIDAFPAFPLSLFRLLETTEWLKHPVFQSFTAINT